MDTSSGLFPHGYILMVCVDVCVCTCVRERVCHVLQGMDYDYDSEAEWEEEEPGESLSDSEVRQILPRMRVRILLIPPCWGGGGVFLRQRCCWLHQNSLEICSSVFCSRVYCTATNIRHIFIFGLVMFGQKIVLRCSV